MARGSASGCWAPECLWEVRPPNEVAQKEALVVASRTLFGHTTWLSRDHINIDHLHILLRYQFVHIGQGDTITAPSNQHIFQDRGDGPSRSNISGHIHKRHSNWEDPQLTFRAPHQDNHWGWALVCSAQPNHNYRRGDPRILATCCIVFLLVFYTNLLSSMAQD